MVTSEAVRDKPASVERSVRTTETIRAIALDCRLGSTYDAPPRPIPK